MQPRFGILLLIVLSAFILNAQPVERQKLVTAYVYSFALNIDWPDDSRPFRIQVIATEQKIISEFNSLSINRRINDRPIEIRTSQELVPFEGIDLIYLSPEYSSLLKSANKRVENKPVLIVSDGYQDQRFVMINFIPSANQLAFEINRANVLNQGLGINKDMVLLGGTEVDVARLYKEAQGSMEETERRIAALQKQYDALDNKVAQTEKSISDKNAIIAKQTDEIIRKQEVVNIQQMMLDSIQLQFATSISQIDSLTSLYTSLQDEVSNLEGEVERQRDNVFEGNKVLEKQRKLIARQDLEIRDREIGLEEMGSVVDSQKNTLFLLIAFLVVLIVFLIFVFFAYRSRRRDAMKLTKLLNELKETQSQLVQSEKMASLGVLTAGIAHEINNAINFVYSGIHILNDKFNEIKPVMRNVKDLHVNGNDAKEELEKLILEKERAGYDEAESTIELMMKNIRIGAERTTEIVKGLRTFSRFETEKLSKINVHKDIDVALLLLQSRHKDIVEIKKKFDSNIPEIDGFKGQLSQAFLNIISNAIDALNTKKSPKITIKTSHGKKDVTISIKDNGKGIGTADLEKVFDPFFTTKKIGSGTGLGLSITYGIIEKHGGTIQVKSKVEKGTEFIIKLPIKLLEEKRVAAKV